MDQRFIFVYALNAILVFCWEQFVTKGFEMVKDYTDHDLVAPSTLNSQNY